MNSPGSRHADRRGTDMKEWLRIGTAGWQLPKTFRELFQAEGSQLEKYSGRFNAIEINSTFYRLPRAATVERWAAAVPADFRFAVKLPKRITHEAQLRNVGAAVHQFADVMEAFGAHAGPVLVQMPPRLAFSSVAEDFLHQLHEQGFPSVVVEPRHSSWFTADVNAMLLRLDIARVAADPPRADGDGIPGGRGTLAYYRWHGQPRVYWSAYDDATLHNLATTIRSRAANAKEVWVIFDNTAFGAATGNALTLLGSFP
ncbi:MAG: DUF72 domain-containing protein [Flavobacteriales bacterium]